MHDSLRGRGNLPHCNLQGVAGHRRHEDAVSALSAMRSVVLSEVDPRHC
jgi:hypothetical protein